MYIGMLAFNRTRKGRKKPLRTAFAGLVSPMTVEIHTSILFVPRTQKAARQNKNAPQKQQLSHAHIYNLLWFFFVERNPNVPF